MAEKLALVVEDERLIAMLLALLAEDCGMKAVVAGDGSEALEMMRTRKPDLLLLDLIMPVMSGDKLLAIMETDPDLSDVPVIVISTSTEVIKGVERQLPRLRKPFEPAEVKRLIQETLAGDRLAAAVRSAI
jgi:CheY-like chemotaxis protein